jgi:ABC-type bacteriocin/lantibiotic exporter with double-glycine peptidase domain
VGGLASTIAILLLGALAVLDGAMTTGGLAA